MTFRLSGLPVFYEELNDGSYSLFDAELDEITKAYAVEQGRIKGFCNIGGNETDFIISSDNLRENTVASVSSSINRHRQLICALSMAIFNVPYASLAEIAAYINHHRLRLYTAEANSVLWGFLKRNLDPALFVCSEYFGSEYKSGEEIKGVLHQDLQHTSFENEAFDIILTSEVFEHIPDAITAEKEIVRVLKKGGVYCFTVPFIPNNSHDLILADIDDDGNTRYYAEPQFHGDPVRPDEGILVYRLFSYPDLRQRFENVGCKFKAYRFWSKTLGILGNDCWAFSIRRG